MKELFLGLVCGLIFSAAAIAGPNVSGKWTGTFTHNGGEGGHAQPIYMVLKQDGSKLAGSGGPNESTQHPFEDGKVEGNRLTFDVPTGKGSIHFDLQVKEDELAGEMSHGGGDGSESAKVSLKRVAEK